VLKLLAKICQL